MADLQREFGGRWHLTYGGENGFRASHRTAWPPVVEKADTAAGLAEILREREAG